MSARIRYRDGYRYQTVGLHVFDLSHYQLGTLSDEHGNRFVSIDADGQLTIRDGYAWDGASGPAWDTRSNLRASLVHDALYQLIRMGALPPSAREPADRVYYDLCREDGMGSVRARLHLWALRRFGTRAADPVNVKQVQTAP